jgi:hypothetical protein
MSHVPGTLLFQESIMPAAQSADDAPVPYSIDAYTQKIRGFEIPVLGGSDVVESTFFYFAGRAQR